MSQLTNDISSALWAKDAAKAAQLLEGHCADELMVYPNVPLLVHACDIPKLTRECLDVVLKHTRDVNIADYRGQTGLMTAAVAENAKLVRRMLSAGADVQLRDREGRNVLHLAVLVSQPNPDLLRVLMDAGASPASINNSGETPLHLAARVGHLPTIRLLLERHAPVNAASKQGRTALHHAAEGGKYDVCQHLIQSGAVVDIADAEGWTPLLVSIALWKYPAAQVLLASGASANARLKPDAHTFGGATALQLALGQFDGWLRDERDPKRAFDRDFFTALVRAGADLNARLPDGKSLASLAGNDGYALEFLRQHGVTD